MINDQLKEIGYTDTEIDNILDIIGYDDLCDVFNTICSKYSSEYPEYLEGKWCVSERVFHKSDIIYNSADIWRNRGWEKRIYIELTLTDEDGQWREKRWYRVKDPYCRYTDDSKNEEYKMWKKVQKFYKDNK